MSTITKKSNIIESTNIVDKKKKTNIKNIVSEDLETIINENIIYEKNPIDKDTVNNLESELEKLNLKQKLKNKTKTFIRVVREIMQNTFDHSLKNKPTLTIKENSKGKYLSIKTSNYFDGGDINKQKLEQSLEKINNSNEDEIKKAYMEALNNGEYDNKNVFSGAGLGLLDIARKIKKMISGKIFYYKIEEEKDENNHKIYKLDLETKFPIPDMGMAA